MRLQLIGCAALALLTVSTSASHASAQAEARSSARVRTSLYQDDDATTISTTVVAASAALGESITIDAHGLADVVSTASVDVVSAATKRWQEIRKEAQGGVGYTDGTTTLGAAYIYSVENDWFSHTVSLAGSHDFFGHDLTLGLRGSFVDNHVGRSHDSTFEESMSVLGGALYAVIVGSPSDLWSVSYDVSHLSGYQASPYRYARFRDPSSPDQVLYAGGSAGQPGERLPDLRSRHSITVRYNRALFEDTALRSHARIYRDDWGVSSLTAGTEYVVGYAPWELALSARGYAQKAASFYEDIYPREKRYMTADRKLGDMFDVFVGPRAALILGDLGPLSELRIEAEVTGFMFWFPDFAAMPRREGFVADLGIGGYF